MSTKLTSLVNAHYVFLARSFAIILGFIAVWWGIFVIPVFWQASSIERIASRITAGDPFKVEILERQLPIIDSIETSVYCRPAALRSAAIVRLRITDEALSAGAQEANNAPMDALRSSIHESLSCSPADPYLWLALSWMETIRNVSDMDSLIYLKISYQLGPNEGWIGLQRNRLAFAGFERLSAAVAELTINEFIALLKSGFYEEAAEIFAGTSSRVRGVILPRLKDIALRYRQEFANSLHKRGYDIIVPDTKRPESHPRR